MFFQFCEAENTFTKSFRSELPDPIYRLCLNHRQLIYIYIEGESEIGTDLKFQLLEGIYRTQCDNEYGVLRKSTCDYRILPYVTRIT